MSIVKDLLAIKRFRESKAETAVHRQRLVLAAAHREQDEAVRALEEYQAWAQRREATLYRELCSRVVTLRDIEEVQQAVAGFRVEEQSRVEQRELAEERVDTEAVQLDEDVAAHKQAVKMKQKFVELAEVQAAELWQENERREDLELEEVAGNGHRRGVSDNAEAAEAW